MSPSGPELHERVIAELRTAYDASVPEREARQVPGWQVAERDRFARVLAAAGARSLLDVGAGIGADARAFAERGLRVRAVDLSPALVAACRRRGVDAVVAEVTRLDPGLGPVDAVWSLNCLLHVPDVLMPAALRGIHRVLTPGGSFYLGCVGGDGVEVTPEKDHYRPRRFHSYRTSGQLLDMVTPFFDVVDVRTLQLSDSRFHALVLRAPRACSPGRGALLV